MAAKAPGKASAPAQGAEVPGLRKVQTQRSDPGTRCRRLPSGIPEAVGARPPPPGAAACAPQHRPQARALRQAVQSFKAGDLTAFHETLALAAFRESPVSVTLARPQDPDCPLIGISEGFELMTGYSRAETIGRNCRFLNCGCTISAQDRHSMRIAVRTGRSFTGVMQNRRKDGELFRNLLHMTSLRIGTSVYILGLQADVTNIEVDVAREETMLEIRNLVDAIFAANVNAWAALQISQYGAVKMGGVMPYAESLLRPRCDPELYVRARDTFVSLEHGLLQNHLQDKNTFLEVYDTDDDPKTYLMGLRRVYSEPAMAYSLCDQASTSSSLPPVETIASTLELLPRVSEKNLLRERGPSKEAGVGQQDKLPAAGAESPSSPRLEEGGLKSVGSANHPDGCTACNFFCYSLIGCSKGEECHFCHLDHPRRGRRRGRKRRCHREAGEAGPQAEEAPDGDCSGEEAPAPPAAVPEPPEALVRQAPQQGPLPPPPPLGLLPLLNSLELLAPLPTPMAMSLKTQGKKEVEAELSLEYSEAVICMTLGQRRNVLPFIGGPLEPLKFSVSPALPRGIRLDPTNGVISGVALEATAIEGASAHTIVAEGSIGNARTTVHILVTDPPAEANTFPGGMTIAPPWVCEDGTMLTPLRV